MRRPVTRLQIKEECGMGYWEVEWVCFHLMLYHQQVYSTSSLPPKKFVGSDAVFCCLVFCVHLRQCKRCVRPWIVLLAAATKEVIEFSFILCSHLTSYTCKFFKLGKQTNNLLNKINNKGIIVYKLN